MVSLLPRLYHPCAWKPQPRASTSGHCTWALMPGYGSSALSITGWHGDPAPCPNPPVAALHPGEMAAARQCTPPTSPLRVQDCRISTSLLGQKIGSTSRKTCSGREAAPEAGTAQAPTRGRLFFRCLKNAGNLARGKGKPRRGPGSPPPGLLEQDFSGNTL